MVDDADSCPPNSTNLDGPLPSIRSQRKCVVDAAEGDAAVEDISVPAKRKRSAASGATAHGLQDVGRAMDVQASAPLLDDLHEPLDGVVEWELLVEPAVDVDAPAPTASVLHAPSTNAPSPLAPAGGPVEPLTDAPDPQLVAAMELALAPWKARAAAELARDDGLWV
jgi:hypothetical protein